jgi:hypothetical protein
MPLTDTVTFTDLIARYESEQEELQDAYDELREFATTDHGDNKLQWPEELQQMAVLYEQTAEQLEQRINILSRLQDEYNDGAFTIKMLSGQDTLDIETELKVMARDKGVDVEVVEHERNKLLVDKAVVDAPESIPREDDSPVVSQAESALMRSLFEAIQTFNQAGDTDFRASGFGDAHDLDLPESFDAPSN